jgi:purine-cytosine permease-like protein
MFSSFFVAYLATFGPKTGLRQMTVSRYSYGWYGNKVMAILQCASCVGWSAVNVTVGGQTLRTLSNNTLPTPVAIVILAVVRYRFCLDGGLQVHLLIINVNKRWAHLYERYQWIPVVIVYFILLGEGAHQGFSSADGLRECGSRQCPKL